MIKIDKKTPITPDCYAVYEYITGPSIPPLRLVRVVGELTRMHEKYWVVEPVDGKIGQVETLSDGQLTHYKDFYGIDYTPELGDDYKAVLIRSVVPDHEINSMLYANHPVFPAIHLSNVMSKYIIPYGESKGYMFVQVIELGKYTYLLYKKISNECNN